jgi:S1-C subfamily serine protease
MRRWPLLLVAAALAVGQGCGGLAAEPPAASPEKLSPPVAGDAPAARGITQVRIPTLSQDGFERRAESITVRVRNLSCAGLGTGSGFAIDRSTLITNRHVVAGASRLEVNTSDGRTYDVTAAEVGVLGDVAFVKVDGDLPVVANLDGRAQPGSKIAAVGYPEGGPFTLETGAVINRTPGERFGINGPVVRITADVRPGNSGGPLLDRRGRVAGVVFALELDTGFGVAMPMSTVNELLDQAGTTSVPACGFE